MFRFLFSFIWVSFPVFAISFNGGPPKSLVYSEFNPGRISFRFDPILTEENYQSALALNDYSNAVAIAQTSEKFPKLIQFLDERTQKISKDLKTRGWKKIILLKGATGVNNQEQDLTGVMTWNRKKRLILISFHGSRNGSILLNNGSGDWGANLDYTPNEASELGLKDCPPFHVKVHRGFGRNFQSIQKNLYKQVAWVMTHFSRNDLKETWIWVTGHSKGAAMASLAVAFLKSHLSHQSGPLSQVQLAALLFSGPRVFFEDQIAPHSSQWVNSIVGRGNILRINVHGDPIPVVFPKALGWRDLGFLVKDSIQNTNFRARYVYGKNVSSFFSLQGWAGYHYGSGLRSTSAVNTGYEFDPNIVISHSELFDGLIAGTIHTQDPRNSI